MNRNRLAVALAAPVAALALAPAAVGTVTPGCGEDGTVTLTAGGFVNPGGHAVTWTVGTATGSATVRNGDVISTGVAALTATSGTFAWGSRPGERQAFTAGPCATPPPPPPPPPTDPVPTPTPPAPVTGDPVPVPVPVPVQDPTPPPPVTPPPVTPPSPRPSPPRVRCPKGASLATLRARGCIRLARCPRGRLPIFTRDPRTKAWTSRCVTPPRRRQSPAVTG